MRMLNVLGFWKIGIVADRKSAADFDDDMQRYEQAVTFAK